MDRAGDRRSCFPSGRCRRSFARSISPACSARSTPAQLTFAGGTAALADRRAFAGFLGQLRAVDWVVYAKRPFAGPEQVLDYLGRYTHRVALSNDRLVDHRDGRVRFRWKDYADHDRVKVMTLEADEFLRRFLLHVVPRGFMRIRHFGLLANRTRRDTLTRCRDLLGQPPPEDAARIGRRAVHRLTGVDLSRCPVCGEGQMQITAIVVRRAAAAGYLMRPVCARASGVDHRGHASGRPRCASRRRRHRSPPTGAGTTTGYRAHRARLGPRAPSCTLARLDQKSHRVTPDPPYNPHSVAAAQPRGFVQQGLSALSPRRCSPDHRGRADETLFVGQHSAWPN